MNKIARCCAALTLTSACLQPTVEGRTDGGQTVTDAGVAYFGVAHKDCGPTDGPATTFTLSTQPLTCDKPSIEGFFVTVYSRSLRQGDAFSLPAMGTACQCGVIANRATQGVVVIDSVTDGGLSGHLNATFGTGGVIDQPFNVVVCEDGVVLCG